MPSLMHRFLLVFSVLGLLLLGSCMQSRTVMIENSNGRRVGDIQIQGTQTATILSTYGEERGRIRGNVVRNTDGKRLGSFVERDGYMMILDASENPVGSLEDGTNCYGKGKEILGKISETVDSGVAAGACLVMFLQ